MTGPLQATAGANPRVCLDFGTSFSKASVYLGAQAKTGARVAPLRLGAAAGAGQPYLVPTALFLDQHRLYCGPNALEHARAGVHAKRDPILSFKMLLSARDVEGTLALKLGPSIDPSRTISNRDALVLYLAYLDRLIRTAILVDTFIPDSLADAPLRLTSPLWRHGSGAEQTLARLYDEAEAVSASLGPCLATAIGAPLDEARSALDRAAERTGKGRFAGIVSEVKSAAAAYATFARPESDVLLVMDVGAGTTDIAGFKLRRSDAGVALDEIKAARQCCALAGDEIDTALVHQMVRRSRARSSDAEASVWRALRIAARELKHDLFQSNKCKLNYEGRRIVLSSKALYNDPEFKAFCRGLASALANSLEPVLAAAREDKAKSVTVCLAGGGAHLPFLDDVVAKAAKLARAPVKVITERFDESWARPQVAGVHHDYLEKAFTQIVIALGGALASLPEPVASSAYEAA